MAKKIILTGERCTGKLHLGHYVGTLRERLKIQASGDYDEFYIMIADGQSLTDNSRNVQKVRDNLINVALDYLAIGLDPSKVTMFIQTEVPELAELSFYLMNMVSLNRLLRNPTVKTEIKEKGFGESVPVGFATYPVSQSADILCFDGTIVPVGDDQLPMVEQCREIARTFNQLYGYTFEEPKAVVSGDKSCARLPGLDGNAKMSKSLGNCIYLSDTTEEVSRKVMSMYTDPDHIHVNDPGKVEGNMVFTYLDVFATNEDVREFMEGYSSLEDVKAHYRRGGLGDVKIKKLLIAVLEKLLTPIRERRKYYENNISEVYDIIFAGSDKARSKAAQVLARVKKNMGINYREMYRGEN